MSKRFPAHEVPGYIAAQVLGGILGAGVLYLIATGRAGFVPGGFASNGYGEHSPGGYSLLAGFCAETVFASFFSSSFWARPTAGRRRALRPWPLASPWP